MKLSTMTDIFRKNALTLNYTLLGLVPVSCIILTNTNALLWPHLILLVVGLFICIVETSPSKIAWLLRILFPAFTISLLLLGDIEDKLEILFIPCALFLATVSITIIRILKLLAVNQNLNKKKEEVALYWVMGICLLITSLGLVYAITSKVEADKQKEMMDFVRENFVDEKNKIQQVKVQRDSLATKVQLLEQQVDSLSNVIQEQDDLYSILQIRSIAMIERLKVLEGQKGKK